jgi:hypothetical protein
MLWIPFVFGAVGGQSATNQASLTVFFLIVFVPYITAPLVASAVASGSPEGNCSCDSHCYRELGETDMWTSLALKSYIVPWSAYAATTEMYGPIDQLMDAFSSLIDLV